MSTKEIKKIDKIDKYLHSSSIDKIEKYLLAQVKKAACVKVKHGEENTNYCYTTIDEYATADGKVTISMKQNEKSFNFSAKVAVKGKISGLNDGTYAIDTEKESEIDALFDTVSDAVEQVRKKRIEAARKAAEKAKKKAENEKKKAEAAKKKAEAAKKKAAHVPYGVEQALATAAGLNPSNAGKKSKPAKKR